MWHSARLNPTQIGSLVQKAWQVIRFKHYSIRTEESYLRWIRVFLKFHDSRNPFQMRKPEVTRFLAYLAADRKVAASTQNQALCALLFLYHERFSTDHSAGLTISNMPKGRREIPLVFTRKEVSIILAHLEGTKWIMTSILYGAGLRLMECIRLSSERH